MSELTFPSNISRSHPYDLCMYFNGEDKLMGYLTYIAYKNYKLDKITKYKKEHAGKDPKKQYLDDFKNNLLEKDYESFIKKAEELKQELLKPVVVEAVKDQLPTAIANSNYNKIEDMLNVSSMNTADNGSKKSIGNVVNEIHNATTHQCKSFWIAVGASALGALCLALFLIFIDWFTHGSIFQLIKAICVPMSGS